MCKMVRILWPARLFFAAAPLLAVFAARRVAAADVPLPEIDAEHPADLLRERLIVLLQPLGDVFMYGRLAHAEFGGAGAHRATRLQHVLRLGDRALQDIIPHTHFPHRTILQFMSDDDGLCEIMS